MAFCSALPVYRSPVRRRSICATLVVTLGTSCSLVTGCGLGTITSAPGVVPSNGKTLQGKVHGGQQPVSGASIQLYSAGTGGYATGSAPLLTSAVTTDAAGNFSITNDYTCPVGDAEVYITASGGNPGLSTGTSNAALVLMAALGSCNQLQANAASTFISINEVTTVASAFALAPFSQVDPSGTGIIVGTSSSNTVGLQHAMSTINNLVDVSSGFARTITPAYAAGRVPSLNTSIVPAARMNALANILASCANTAGNSGSQNNCGQLFTLATPTQASAAVDTLQAILYIAQNPANNVSSLFGLAQSNAPFQPTLPAAPSDWLLAIGYTGGGLGLAPGDANGQMQDHHLAIDATSTLWVTAQGLAGGNSVPTGSSIIAQFDDFGAPLTPATTEPTPSTVNFGGYSTSASLGSAGDIIAFDQSGLAWITGYQSAALDAYSAGPAPALSAPISPSIGGFDSLAIDAVGNVWGSGVNSMGFGELLEYTGSGNLVSPAGGYTGGGSYGNNYYADPVHLTFDSTGNNLWASDNMLYDFYLINSSSGQLNNDYYPTGGAVTPLAAGASGNIYGCPTGTSSILVFNASSTTGSTASYASSTGRGCGSQMTVDGLGHLWILSGTGLDEYSSTGVLLSPAAAYTGSSSAEGLTIQNLAVDLAIDMSGNVWVLNSNTGIDPSNPRNVLYELVGAAAPVATPVSQALANGQTAARP